MNAPQEILSVNTRHLGREVHLHDEVPSTSDLAAETGHIVVADSQTHGRGQYGRTWLGERGHSLLMSLTIRPPVELCRPVILTAWVAVSIPEAILDLTKVQTKVKWPNDLLIRGKKVCGILIEQKQRVTVGIGLNLSQSAEYFAETELPDASSLFLATNVNVSRDRAIETTLQHLDAGYERLLVEGPSTLESDWKWRIGLLGRPVTVELFDNSTLSGRLMDMGFEGVHVEEKLFRPESIRRLSPAGSI